MCNSFRRTKSSNQVYGSKRWHPSCWWSIGCRTQLAWSAGSRLMRTLRGLWWRRMMDLLRCINMIDDKLMIHPSLCFASLIWSINLGSPLLARLSLWLQGKGTVSSAIKVIALHAVAKRMIFTCSISRQGQSWASSMLTMTPLLPWYIIIVCLSALQRTNRYVSGIWSNLSPPIKLSSMIIRSYYSTTKPPYSPATSTRPIQTTPNSYH